MLGTPNYNRRAAELQEFAAAPYNAAMASGEFEASLTGSVLKAAAELREAVAGLRFGPPVTHVYNPLEYAWEAHSRYIERALASGPDGSSTGRRVVFLGMNPGPWGMAQTGVPFGEIASVRDWIGLEAPVGSPGETEQNPRGVHPKRPVEGFECPKSEVSGRRLWGLFRDRFASADFFFAEHFVANYCPLVFMEESSRNRTPDKLPVAERTELFRHCDEHLSKLIEALKPAWLVGVGAFARARAEAAAVGATRPDVTGILHPSPASPRANADFSGTAERQLAEAGVWDSR